MDDAADEVWITQSPGTRLSASHVSSGVVGLIIVGCMVASGCHGNGRDRGQSQNHGHEGLDDYIARQESPDRAKWQKPNEVLAALALKPGERVADLACGPGYFTIPIARSVGPTGRVWAVDIEPRMLERAREHADAARLTQIDYVLAAADDPKLPPGRIDTIFIVNTYHHFDDRRAYVAKLRQALAPGGRIVVIDFVPKSREERGFGPPLEMQLPRSAVDADFAANGFTPAKVHEVLPEQYFVEYRLP